MKQISIKVLVFSLLVMIIITYLLGWLDLFNNGKITDNWIENVIYSIKYYVYWVIPYWWLLILIGTALISLILHIIKIAVKNN
jgi:hypothetical protein